MDFAALGGHALRILKDPAEGLGALHRPGQKALVQGLIFGMATGVLVPIVGFIVWKVKLGQWYRPAFGDILGQCLGGVLFVATGAAVGFILRTALARGERADWRDDVYLFGSSMVPVLATTLVASLFLIFGGKLFLLLATVVAPLGLVLLAFTYQSGLARVGKLDSHRSICTALTAISAALIVGALIGFLPFQAGGGGPPAFSAPSMEDAMESLPGQMEDLIEKLKSRNAGGGF